ncbi:unnamed protein product [Parascedosporium putredinis]|uniref:DUF7904 domain-containing protein n=1 Tax=Parascedosporium putredinis TaxID=1442378 RepID=A0A9P1MEN2_9PEZI|nr:unnamed protein product [Parascedosporium putredinis]CAI8000846.1 unnamed protein product [Parascedosporium putredinis]
MATPITEVMTSPPTSSPTQIQLVDSSRASINGQIQLVDSSIASPSYGQSYSYSRRRGNDGASVSSPGQIKLVDSSAMREAPKKQPLISSATVVETKNQPEPTAKVEPKEPPQEQPRVEPNEEPKTELPPPSPKKLNVKRMSKFLDDAGQPTPKLSASSTDDTPARSPRRMSRPPSPIKSLESQPTQPAASSPSAALAKGTYGRPESIRKGSTGQGINTVSVQRLQIFGDGKMVPIPAHNERVVFELSTVKATEGYVNKEAKSIGGKMVVVKQGKETPEFLQAIGGVLITRRGSSNKYDSLASNMLCGRRYFGFVAFDEVDFSPVNLCSGFPFLINQQSQCFLWKGKGTDSEELESARLVGMDLSLTGQLEEIDDGNEPATFWDIFDGGSKQLSADHWRLKPSYSKYCCRLFCSDASSKQQILELSPYCQADLSTKKIYVLDAFFEMYIIVGAEAKSQYASFRNALDFAQEYGILASGMEDRPFVPISTVVLEGIPRDLKSVFRKWRDAYSPTVMPPPTTPGSGLKRGRSLRIVPLTQALQALAE